MVRRISRRGVASSKRSLASREETSRHAAMRPRSAKKGGARYARGEEAEVSDVGAFPRPATDALRVPSLGAPWHLGDWREVFFSLASTRRRRARRFEVHGALGPLTSRKLHSLRVAG